ncbi:MAG: hypothetical protein IJW67_11195 [Blautia sp.]|nr:hypothetical protein [Blautia sp.]
MNEINKEKRIYQDVNGSYLVQFRWLPVEPSEPLDGWRSTYTTEIFEDAKAKLDAQSGAEVESVSDYERWCYR